jgi:hypothetical protein
MASHLPRLRRTEEATQMFNALGFDEFAVRVNIHLTILKILAISPPCLSISLEYTFNSWGLN